jgi:hypothetical protein
MEIAEANFSGRGSERIEARPAVVMLNGSKRTRARLDSLENPTV